jgi:DNA-binding NarL/FixJ family response regulator
MRAPDAASIRVLIADSMQMRSQLLAKALRQRPGFTVASCKLDSDAIIHELEAHATDILLVNTNLRESVGHDLAVLRRTHMAYPGIHKILLVDSYDRDTVVKAFRSGVRGIFSTGEADLRALRKCIQRVHEGQIWANSEQLGHLLQVISRVPSLRVVNTQGTPLLTPREEQVVALVADGLSNREVAQELGLCEDTVKTYLFRIFDKLGISSRVELALYAVHHGEMQPAEWLASGS